jgi:hypothetical protein
MTLELACNVLAMFVCMRVANRIFGASSALAVALVFLGKNALICGTSGMEWSIALLALALATELAVIPNEPSFRGALWACGVGLLAVLARSDSAVWLGILTVAALIAHRSDNAKKVGALAFGSALGALLIGVHTHSITGVWLQDSALAKMHWAAQRGVDIPAAFNTVAMATGVSWLGNGLDRAVLLALLCSDSWRPRPRMPRSARRYLPAA